MRGATLVLLVAFSLVAGCQHGPYQLATAPNDKNGNAGVFRLDTATGEVCYYIGNSNGVSPFGCWPQEHF